MDDEHEVVEVHRARGGAVERLNRRGQRVGEDGRVFTSDEDEEVKLMTGSDDEHYEGRRGRRQLGEENTHKPAAARQARRETDTETEAKESQLTQQGNQPRVNTIAASCKPSKRTPNTPHNITTVNAAVAQ